MTSLNKCHEFIKKLFTSSIDSMKMSIKKETHVEHDLSLLMVVYQRSLINVHGKKQKTKKNIDTWNL